MKFENIEVFNFGGALRGMRNPMNSWDRSDSRVEIYHNALHPASLFNADDYNICHYIGHDAVTVHIGPNDLELAQKLTLAGTAHSKFLRQIMVCMDVIAPIYLWKEADTYKVGTVANSTSTMHKLASTPITPECFEFDSVLETFGGLDEENDPYVVDVICNLLENYRTQYLKTGDKRLWRALIQLLPESWLQRRTMTLSYQNLRTMYFDREFHKLTEWAVDFVKMVSTLPYGKELIMLKAA